MVLTQLTPDLWVGSLHPIADIERLGIKSVICVMGNTDYDGKRFHIPLLDEKGNETSSFLRILLTYNRLEFVRATPVLVQCRGGASRSVVACGFILAVKNGYKTVRDAAAFIKTKHGTALPNQDVIDVAEKALKSFRVLPSPLNAVKMVKPTLGTGIVHLD